MRIHIDKRRLEDYSADASVLGTHDCDSLTIGDVLSTVLMDAVDGILANLKPELLPRLEIYVCKAPHLQH